MSAAPVSPAGALRIRPKSDGTTLQLSYNAGAYFDMGAAGASSVRLDQVLDPTLNSDFTMGTTALNFDYTASSSVDQFLIQTVSNATGSGTLLKINTPGTTNATFPFRIDTNGITSLIVAPNGNATFGANVIQTLTNTSTSSTLSYLDQNLTISPASSSTAEHRLFDQSVSFGTVQNTGSIRLRYADIAKSSGATLSSFYVDNVTFSSSAGTTSTASGYALAFNINLSTTSSIIGFSTGVNTSSTGAVTQAIAYSAGFDGSGGAISTATGFRVTTNGTVTTLYGFRSPSTSLSGFGTDTPTATLHASGSVKLDLGSDATGDIFYRNSGGSLTRLGVGTNGHVLTLSSGVPVWQVAPGGSGSPGGSSGNLQYNNAGAFGGVANSAVSGANLTLGGTVTMDNAGAAERQLVLSSLAASTNQLFTQRYEATATAITWRFERGRGTAASPANLSANDQVGTLDFYGRLSGSMQKCGSLTALYDTNALRTIRMYGPTSTIYVEASENDGAYLYNNSNFVQVTSSAVKFSTGSSNSVYYRNSSGNLAGVTIGSNGQVLTVVSGVPAWQTPAAGGTPGGSGSELQYRSGASTFGAVTSSSVSGADITLGGNVILSSGTISFPDNVRQTFNPGTTNAGLNVGSHTADPSSPSNGDVVYNTVTGTFRFRQAGAWISLSAGTTPGGSGSELQYRSSSTTFGAVSNSSVSGSVITLGNSTDFTTLQGASIALQGDNGTTLSARVHHASLAPSFASYRSRGTNASKTAVQSGDTLFSSSHYGYYDASSLRVAGQTNFTARANWSSTEATTTYGVATLHGTNVVPLMRETLGGFKILTDNTLANLFTFTFAAADHKAASGEIELLFIAKQTTGSNQIAAYRRVMNFTVYHDGATNTGVMQVILNTGGNTAIETSGTFDIKHTTGSAGSEVAISTSLLPTTFDSVTYKVLVDSSFTVSAMYCFFNVKMNGEVEMTLA